MYICTYRFKYNCLKEAYNSVNSHQSLIKYFCFASCFFAFGICELYLKEGIKFLSYKDYTKTEYQVICKYIQKYMGYYWNLEDKKKTF